PRRNRTFQVRSRKTFRKAVRFNTNGHVGGFVGPFGARGLGGLWWVFASRVIVLRNLGEKTNAGHRLGCKCSVRNARRRARSGLPRLLVSSSPPFGTRCGSASDQWSHVTAQTAGQQSASAAMDAPHSA